MYCTWLALEPPGQYVGYSIYVFSVQIFEELNSIQVGGGLKTDLLPTLNMVDRETSAAGLRYIQYSKLNTLTRLVTRPSSIYILNVPYIVDPNTSPSVRGVIIFIHVLESLYQFITLKLCLIFKGRTCLGFTSSFPLFFSIYMQRNSLLLFVFSS